MVKKALKAPKKVLKKPSKRTTVNADEVRQFDEIGDRWWDPQGPMKPLHRLNPVRLEYIRHQVCKNFDRDVKAMKVMTGLKAADIGCGGGLVAEPFARLGAAVTGVDAGKENIRVAKDHAKLSGLKIDYQATTVEKIAAAGKKYDVVTALEIVEHVDDVALFVESCCKIVKKGGILVMSTLSRTPKSFLMGIVAAEYMLRWLPVGTHDWKKFLKPSELARELEDNGMTVTDACGLIYNPMTQQFGLDREDLSVNYLMTAVRK